MLFFISLNRVNFFTYAHIFITLLISKGNSKMIEIAKVDFNFDKIIRYQEKFKKAI